MNAVADGIPGNGNTPPAWTRGFAVRGDGKLEQDLRSPVTHAADVPNMIGSRSLGFDANLGDNSGATQQGMPAPRNFGIGVLHRRDHPRNSRRNHGLGAGRRFAVMRARFERDIERGAPRILTGAAQGFDFGVRPAS